MKTVSKLWGMLREQVSVDILSEMESPFTPVTIEEQVASMLFGSSLVPKKKRKGQKHISSVSKKRHTRTSARAAKEAA